LSIVAVFICRYTHFHPHTDIWTYEFICPYTHNYILSRNMNSYVRTQHMNSYVRTHTITFSLRHMNSYVRTHTFIHVWTYEFICPVAVVALAPKLRVKRPRHLFVPKKRKALSLFRTRSIFNSLDILRQKF
jgi:hypothetical protein